MSQQTIHHPDDSPSADWSDRSAQNLIDPPGTVVRRHGAGVLSPASWAELLYAVIGLVPAITFFVLAITLLALGAGLAIIYVGVPLLAIGLLTARAGGYLQRVLAGVLLGLPVPGPAPIRPRGPGALRGLSAVLTDPGCWRAVAYHCVKILLAPVTFGFAVGFYAAGLGSLSYGIWYQHLPQEIASDGSRHRGMQWWPDYFVDTWPRAMVLAGVGVLLLVLAPRVVRFFTTIDRVLIAALLGGSGRP